MFDVRNETPKSRVVCSLRMEVDIGWASLGARVFCTPFILLHAGLQHTKLVDFVYVRGSV